MKFFFFLLTLFLIPPAFAAVVTDDIGQQLVFKQPATRIISLAPDITEILFAIGAGDKIVGTVDASDYPAAAKTLSQVGSYSGINLEKIIALKPDVIITWQSAFGRQIRALRNLHIPIYVTRPEQLSDVAKSMRNFGKITGNEKKAQQRAQEFMSELANLQKKYLDKKPVKVFYQIGDYNLMTINGRSWISEAIRTCGGENVFANARALAFEVSTEDLWQANPEMIVASANNDAWQKKIKSWTNMAAVKEHHLYSINPDWMDRAGPRILRGTAQLCQLINYSYAKREREVHRQQT